MHMHTPIFCSLTRATRLEMLHTPHFSWDLDTPHYMAVAETPHRIYDMYGGQDSGLKFIVTLREPASRAISSWEFKNEFNPKKGRKSCLVHCCRFHRWLIMSPL